MGLAVYNSIILDLHFPSVCYKKLLTPPVVPAGEASSVGVVSDPTIDDLAEIMPDVAQSLRVRKYKNVCRKLPYVSLLKTNSNFPDKSKSRCE